MLRIKATQTSTISQALPLQIISLNCFPYQDLFFGQSQLDLEDSIRAPAYSAMHKEF